MSLKRLILPVLGGVSAFYAVVSTSSPSPSDADIVINYDKPIPTRQSNLKRLASEPFDVLIIGGGATGVGCAVDATTRGLKTALVEQADFAAGTSSKSTKLVHGGVRYLEKAIKSLDFAQLKLVFEALHERKTVLEQAPHLTRSLPIVTPCFHWYEIPYFWAGMKMYDLIAGSRALTYSRFMSATESLRSFPTLRDENDREALQGTIVYYDGQFDDARLNVALACTASHAGAVVANYCRVESLTLDDETRRVNGAVVVDTLTGERLHVKASRVVNAAGPFTDRVRQLADDKASSMIRPSAGVHITLPRYYAPDDYGLIVPKTKDGRVVFLLPWRGATIAGTTDASCALEQHPVARKKDVDFILETLRDFLSIEVREEDVLSTWSGIRPLAVDPGTGSATTAKYGASKTESIVRDHIVAVEKNGLITVTGGKWTTYRLMAQDAIDAVQATLPPTTRATLAPCRTTQIRLVGAEHYSPTLFAQLVQQFDVSVDVARHLATSYGDQARRVLTLASTLPHGTRRLVANHPVLEAEVVYAARNEYCEHADDFLARRSRLAFLDARAAMEAAPRVVELLAREGAWSRKRQADELTKTRAYLATFLLPTPTPTPPPLSSTV